MPAAAYQWSRRRPSSLPLRATMTPRVAAAAVRIPDPRIVPLPLRFLSGGPQIFVHEGARQALERKLELSFPGPVQFAVTDNRQRMITQTRSRKTLRVRVHMMFLDAPERVQDALVDYIVRGDRDASQVVGAYIDGNSHRIRGSRKVRGPLRTQGKRHDLAELLDKVNTDYFNGAAHDVLVTWGRKSRPGQQPRTTIKLGSYSAEERLIRVHPVLDRKWVPRYFVSYILYHELLHHVVPPVKVAGRTLLHPPELLRRERQFRHYDRAIAWERAWLSRLLRG
jgi:hypothetical protein